MGKSSDFDFWLEPTWRRPQVFFNCRWGPPPPLDPIYWDIIGGCNLSICEDESISNPCAPELDGVCDGPGAEFR